MSRLRTGHKPTDWRDEGEGSARVQGYGGSLVVGGTRPDERLPGRDREVCGSPMLIARKPCARPRGHNGECLSIDAINNRRARQAAYKQERKAA